MLVDNVLPQLEKPTTYTLNDRAPNIQGYRNIVELAAALVIAVDFQQDARPPAARRPLIVNCSK